MGTTVYSGWAQPAGGLSAAQTGAGATSAVASTPAGAFVASDGAVLGVSEVTPYVNITSTQTAFSGPCELAGWDCTVAAGNITIYDGTSTAGVIVVPATALALGRTEFAWKRSLTSGCHVVLSGAATVNVLVGA